MSESSLVTYRNLTNNKTAVNNKQNLYIIPHVYVGQVSTKNGVDHFTTKCGASCQYVIGTDGTVGQCVSEADRSWCTGGELEVINQYGKFVGGTPKAGYIGLDYQAITIEMACDATAPYAINDKVYNTLVKLMADIAIRNNMGLLKWKADVNLVGNPAEQNVVVHRWLAKKSCPGDWVYNRLGEICAKANEIIQAGGIPAPVLPPAPTTVVTEEDMWNYFKSCGLTDAGAAGLMGNLYAESGLKANNLQNNGNNKLGMTDEQFTENVDSRLYSRDTFIHDHYGYGLAQWTFYTRKEALYDFIKSRGLSIADTKAQLDFLISEIKNYKCWSILTSTDDVKTASDAVLTQYEKPADQSDNVKNKRAGYGQTYYDKYANKPVETKTLYKVQVGAFSKIENAERLQAELKSKGYDAFIVKVEQ